MCGNSDSSHVGGTSARCLGRVCLHAESPVPLHLAQSTITVPFLGVDPSTGSPEFGQ